MILIGLFGGSPESREEITLNLIRAAGSELAAFNNPPTVYEGRTPRVDALNIVLRGAGPKVKGAGLVVTHVASRAEADAIRERGGHLWHVMGKPCDFVPIRAEDLPVTAMAGGCRHFLDALEAYSETLLRHGRVR